LGRQELNLQRPDSKSGVLPVAPRPRTENTKHKTQNTKRGTGGCDRGRDRTFNFRLRRPALFRLSYAVVRWGGSSEGRSRTCNPRLNRAPHCQLCYLEMFYVLRFMFCYFVFSKRRVRELNPQGGPGGGRSTVFGTAAVANRLDPPGSCQWPVVSGQNES
jgi:hypothetical protein